jgi:hypothetical protein
MPCQQPPKLLVLRRQRAYQCGELHIGGAPADTHPQNAGDCRRSHTAGSANRWHASGERKIYWATFRAPGRSRPESPQALVVSRVRSEDVQAPADEGGGHAERAAEVLVSGLKRLRQVRRRGVRFRSGWAGRIRWSRSSLAGALRSLHGKTSSPPMAERASRCGAARLLRLVGAQLTRSHTGW